MSTEVEPQLARTGPPETAGAARRSGRRRGRQARTGAAKGFAFTIPYVVGFLAVYVAPVGYALYQSVHQEKRSALGFGAPTTVFAGLANYRDAFADGVFWRSMLRVALFGAVEIPVMLGLALLMALLLDGLAARGARFFRLAYLTPYVVPGVVSALLWLYLYSPTISPISGAVGRLGGSLDFFTPVNTYLSLGNVLVWEQIGFNMILISASLQAIPKELYEAARLDGATEQRIAWSVKIPAIRPVLVLTGMFSIIAALQLFTEPLIIRQEAPGPIGVNFTPMQTIYVTAFSTSNYHYAAALSTVLAVVTGVLAFIFYRVTNRRTAS
ncbi:MAG: multiple sugar transport system permease protein [Streptomyces sp.]|jgi:multiple sugar transport system permease protein|nr:multiple sugar transport system permease protein [Streptomyces sp.]